MQCKFNDVSSHFRLHVGAAPVPISRTLFTLCCCCPSNNARFLCNKWIVIKYNKHIIVGPHRVRCGPFLNINLNLNYIFFRALHGDSMCVKKNKTKKNCSKQTTSFARSIQSNIINWVRANKIAWQHILFVFCLFSFYFFHFNWYKCGGVH